MTSKDFIKNLFEKNKEEVREIQEIIKIIELLKSQKKEDKIYTTTFHSS